MDEFDQKRPSWRIALTANMKSDTSWHPDAPHDAGAEFDAKETIEAITNALQTAGHTVFFCSADRTLPDALQDIQPDICFNIAEGLGGDAREAQVPALCELLGIPYTASRVLANAISLDKTQTKRIWQSLGLPTAHFQEFQSAEDVLQPTLQFPLFVKPAREGTGMGMDLDSIVHDEAALRRQVAWVIETYQQPALVEEYLTGREFTVGFIGNRGTKRPSYYNPDGYYFLPILELGTQDSISPGVYGYDAKSLPLDHDHAPDYLCPADIPHNLRHKLYALTQQAAEALGVCDVSRIDFRLNSEGEPYLLEINTLPGLNPAVSDLCIMARADNFPYETLITEILYLAAERFGLEMPELHPELSFGD